MKKRKDKIIILICLLGMYILGFLVGLTLFDKHDVNRDREVNAKDLLTVQKYLLEK